MNNVYLFDGIKSIVERTITQDLGSFLGTTKPQEFVSHCPEEWSAGVARGSAESSGATITPSTPSTTDTSRRSHAYSSHISSLNDCSPVSFDVAQRADFVAAALRSLASAKTSKSTRPGRPESNGGKNRDIWATTGYWTTKRAYDDAWKPVRLKNIYGHLEDSSDENEDCTAILREKVDIMCQAVSAIERRPPRGAGKNPRETNTRSARQEPSDRESGDQEIEKV